MLAPSLTLLLLLLGSQGQAGTTESGPVSRPETHSGPCSSFSSKDPVFGLSGSSVRLPPHTPAAENFTVIWQVKLSGQPRWRRLLKWSGSLQDKDWTRSHFADRLEFFAQDWTLQLQPALPKDSGQYCLEVTDTTGVATGFVVTVSVWDPVPSPQLQVHLVAHNATWCRLLLNCSVSGGNNVSLAWYRDDAQLCQGPAPHAHLQEEVAAHSTHVYTCNASDAHSWAHSTVSLSPGCDTRVSELWLGPSLWLGFLGVPLGVVLLSTLTCALLQRRRRRTGQSDAKEESGDQSPPRQDCAQEHSPSGEGSTVYATVQSWNRNRNQNQPRLHPAGPPKCPDSEPRTLYLLVQPPHKAPKGSPKAPPSCTVYQEVGGQQPRAQNPARLSRKELQNFEVYC